MPRPFLRLWRPLGGAVVMLCLLLVAASWWLPLPGSGAGVRIDIARGGGTRGAALAVQEAGIAVPVPVFSLYAWVSGDSRRLRAGGFQLSGPVSLAGLFGLLVGGEMSLHELTLVEGWTLAQVRSALARHPGLLHDSEALTEDELRERLGETANSLEGLLFPETYRFPSRSSDFDVLKPAHRLMARQLAQAWEGRDPQTPLRSPREALILASIIEKETGSPADRSKIAAVFVNRLRRGMLLQSDPTTIYGLGTRFDGNLRRRDLRDDHPWNTYVHGGLPPTPIAIPGRASLDAALHPATSTALYFVARGDGSSEFSGDLSAHNRAVARYQLRQ